MAGPTEHIDRLGQDLRARVASLASLLRYWSDPWPGTPLNLNGDGANNIAKRPEPEQGWVLPALLALTRRLGGQGFERE